MIKPVNKKLDKSGYAYRCCRTSCRKFTGVHSQLKTYYPDKKSLELLALMLTYYIPNGYNAGEIHDQYSRTYAIVISYESVRKIMQEIRLLIA
jgi:hypothetical protein